MAAQIWEMPMVTVSWIRMTSAPTFPEIENDLGCQDRDGDGVPDHLDLDPDEPEPASLDGAPDSDGDRVPDDEDLSPEEPGSADSGGARIQEQEIATGMALRTMLTPAPMSRACPNTVIALHLTTTRLLRMTAPNREVFREPNCCCILRWKAIISGLTASITMSGVIFNWKIYQSKDMNLNPRGSGSGISGRF